MSPRAILVIVALAGMLCATGCADLRAWQSLVGYYPSAMQEPPALPTAKSGPPAAAPLLSIAEPPRLQVASAQTPTPQPRQLSVASEPAAVAVDDSLMKLRELHAKAAARVATMETYIFRLRRREVLNNTQRPEELMLVKFRREPWSVYFKWLGNEAKGREVLYVKDRYENQIHTLTAAGDIPLMPGGKRLRVPVDGFLAKSRSRYPITDAGLSNIVDGLGMLVEAMERGDPRAGTVKYLGQIKRPEFEAKVHGVLQTLPPETKHLPKGGQRLLCFDPESHLPVLILTQDESGREVEYYCHDRIQHPVALDDDDFNPEVLWKQK